MILFLDTSALVKLYVREDGSEEILDRARAAGALAASRIAWAEAFAALARRAREHPDDSAAIEEAKRRLRAHWPDYLLVEVTQETVERAGELADVFALRAYDSLQLASARILLEESGQDVAFACFDQRLRKAAAVLGLAVVPG